MATTYHTIAIHPLAPAKVPLGAACNGCGVCCLFEPCPLGIVLSGQRSGACHALRWSEAEGQYRCGAIVAAQDVLAQALPVGLRGLAPLLASLLRRLARRWIAAGVGCDSRLEVVGSDDVSPKQSGSTLDYKQIAGVETPSEPLTIARQSDHD